MNPILRSILAVFAGLVVAALLIGIIEAIGHTLYPLPAGIDPSNREAIAEVMPHAPAGALIFVLIAWDFGNLCGSWLAARLAGRNPMMHAVIVGVILFAGAIYTMLVIPHPVWFWIAAFVISSAATFMGGKLGGRKAKHPPQSPVAA